MDKNLDILAKGAAELGVELSSQAAERFELYLSLIVKWNIKINLTAIDEPREVVIKHFLDSLIVCRALPEGPFAAADIGSGAGFPGIPVKLARPDMEITLVEPARKKAVFLRQAARELGLAGVTVSEDKIEQFAGKQAGRLDVVLSRAFRDPDRLLPLAGPLLSPAGRIVLALGPEWAGVPPPGWRLESLEMVALPFSDITRRLVVFKMD